MKSFLAAVVFAIAAAFAAETVLNGTYQTSSASAFTTEGARVSNPGSNLIVY